MGAMQLILGIILGTVLGWYVRGKYSLINQSALPLLENIMAKVSELSGILAQIHIQTEKIHTEVQALKDSLANVEIPAEAQAHLDAITSTLNAVDQINPDLGTPPTASTAFTG